MSIIKVINDVIIASPLITIVTCSRNSRYQYQADMDYQSNYYCITNINTVKTSYPKISGWVHLNTSPCVDNKELY